MKVSDKVPSQRQPHQTPWWLELEIARARAHYKRGERGQPWLHGVYENHMAAARVSASKVPLDKLMQMRPKRWCWKCETELHYMEPHHQGCGPEFPVED